MKPEKVFKRYDIRGEYPEEINEEFARRLGLAVGSFTQRNFGKKIVVGRDNKDTSKKLKQNLIEGLTSTGATVLDAGEGPTDYIAFAGMAEDAVSIQVTSSHLPLNFNGFKLMYPEGNSFVNEDLAKVKDIFREENFIEGEGSIEKQEESFGNKYRRRVKEEAANYSKDFSGSKIVVDTLGGATKNFLPGILRDLGADVVDIAGDKDQHPYRDPPNPKPENLEELKGRVEEENADFGIATDMDGDRVAVYRNGFISGDQLFGVFTQLHNSDLVASIDTSKKVEKMAGTDGNEVMYTRVGDPFVLEKAVEEKVDLAGEPNGHYAFPNFVPYSSGILSGVIAAGIDFDHYLSKLPDYYTERKNVQVEDKNKKMEAVKEQVKEQFKPISEIDGIKFKDGETTVLVRSSGSSPKLRIIVESENPTTAEQVSWKIKKLIQNA